MWKEIGKSAWHVLQCWSHSGYLCKSQKTSLTLCGRRTTQTVCLQINELGPGSPIQLPSDPYPLKIWAAISNWFASPFLIPPTSSNVSPPFFFRCSFEVAMPLSLLVRGWKRKYNSTVVSMRRFIALTGAECTMLALPHFAIKKCRKRVFP